tara:strand:- start:273 stop:818 length:546 start_codon:yes stop_codon:yes gene_type:complete
MQLKETKEALNKFGKYVIQQVRSNLTKNKNKKKKTSNYTNELYNSLEYKPFVAGNKIGLKFYMDEYGKFQDQGVKGVKGGTSLSGYSYKKSSNLVGVEYHTGTLAKWAKFKRYQARDKKGRFVDYKSTGFALANIIKNYGIKPSLFFTKPFEKAFENLPKDLQDSFVNDAANSIIIPKKNK